MTSRDTSMMNQERFEPVRRNNACAESLIGVRNHAGGRILEVNLKACLYDQSGLKT